VATIDEASPVAAPAPRRATPAAVPPPRGAIVLFDGVCNLCSASVTFIVDRDRRGYFSFAALQSEVGRALLIGLDLPPDALGSVVLIERGRAYTRSLAALRIARHLDGAWPLLFGLMIVPRSLADAVYDWVARNRYRWFGRTESCRLPTPELSARFLDY
jgi:predicted DCC family thiol-disulfide oxidoreductase YuxK